jgi:hypothetical protein
LVKIDRAQKVVFLLRDKSSMEKLHRLFTVGLG